MTGQIRILAMGLVLFSQLAGTGKQTCAADLEACEKEIAKLEQRLEKANDKSKLEWKNTLGQGLADAIVALNSEARSLQSSKQADEKQKAAQLRAQRDGYRERLQTLWGPEATFGLIPTSVEWGPLPKDRVTFAEYMAAESIDKEKLQSYLHTRRYEWRAATVDGNASIVCPFDRDEQVFALHLAAQREVAVFFLIRSSKATKARIEIEMKSAGDRIQSVYINNSPQAPRKDDDFSARVRLREGGNIIVAYLKNTDKPDLRFEIKVKGKNVACGMREK